RGKEGNCIQVAPARETGLAEWPQAAALTGSSCNRPMLDSPLEPALETEMSKKPERDVEKTYPLDDFVAKLRRLADSLENDEPFEIQIAGERIYVPVRAAYNIEHERAGDEEEIEFQVRWTRS